ncbi:MAG: hypothetical protein FJ280_07440 [Planctomycetes bacterium]|nr:hypothetical protein [Planctomycetota bacterium]
MSTQDGKPSSLGTAKPQHVVFLAGTLKERKEDESGKRNRLRFSPSSFLPFSFLSFFVAAALGPGRQAAGRNWELRTDN